MMNILPQLAGSFIKIFRYFFRPLIGRDFTPSQNCDSGIPLRNNISRATVSHCLLHPATHFVWANASSISMRVLQPLSNLRGASFISQPTFKASSTVCILEWQRLRQDQFFPDFFSALGSASNSTLVFMPLLAAICDTSYTAKRGVLALFEISFLFPLPLARARLACWVRRIITSSITF